MRNSLSLDGAPQEWGMSSDAKHMFVSECACYEVAQGQTLKLEKFAAVLSSMNHDVASLMQRQQRALQQRRRKAMKHCVVST